MSANQARIVSLVPSWTETLLWAQQNVVGRTRFCIHPQDQIKNIPAVGGTKQTDLEKLLALKPDFVILDQEENKKEMADQLQAAGVKMLISHVTDFRSAADFLLDVGRQLHSRPLEEMAARYLKIQKVERAEFLEQVRLDGDDRELQGNKIEYVIWKNPYMVIGQGTFIAHVLNAAGLQVPHQAKYPQVEAEDLIKNFCFFSSEPYPFKKDFQKMRDEGFRGLLVDGEKISWYGIRNLLFLEACSK